MAMVVRFSKPIVTIPAGIKQESSNEALFAGLTVCQRDVTA
jgi:hypothetical protein